MRNSDNLLWLAGFKTKLALNERLMAAVVSGDKYTVNKMIQMGASVDTNTPIIPAPQQRIAGPLMAAIHYGHYSIASILLDAGADPTGEAVNVDQAFTPIFLCLHKYLIHERNKIQHENADLKMISLLVEKGADINKHNKGGYTPLGSCVESKCPALVKFLLEMGADANKTNSRNYNALDSAKMWSNNQEVISIIEMHMLHAVNASPSIADGNQIINQSSQRMRL